MNNVNFKSSFIASILFFGIFFASAQNFSDPIEAQKTANFSSFSDGPPQQSDETFGWVLTERKPVKGVIPAPVEGGEIRVDFGDDSIEMLLAKPYGQGAGGSKDSKNPQRLHARYSWSMPAVIQPAGQLVIVVNQEVLSNQTGNFGNAFGVGIAIQNTWYVRGKLADGTMVEPWVLGIGWARPDWAQKDATVTYERTWLWGASKLGDKRMVSVSIQGIGTQRIEYTYEWKAVVSQEEATKTAELPLTQTTQEVGKSPESKTPTNDAKSSAEKLTFDFDNTEAVVGDLQKNAIQLVIGKGAFDQKGKLQVEESKNVVPFDAKRANLIGTPFDITVDQESKRLNEPVLVKLKLESTEIASLKRPIDLWIGYFNGDTWDYFPPQEVNLEEGYVSFETYHFSDYTIAELARIEQINAFAYQNAVNTWAEKDSNLPTKQATEQLVKEILSRNMGITNKSLTQDIVEAIMKENDYAKLLVSYNDNKMDEYGTDLAVLAGKTIVKVVSNESNAKALMKSVTDHSSKISTGVKMGLALADGNMELAAKELSLEILNLHPVTKLFKAAAEVTDRQVKRWRDQELEAAYKVYVNGASSLIPFWGYQVERGDFNQLWDQMRGLQTKILDDAIKNYAAANNKSVSELDEATLRTIRIQTKENLKQEFSKRREQESLVEKLKADNLQLIKVFERANLLTENSFSFTENTTFDMRLMRLFRVKDMILKDTKSKLGFSGVNEGGIISADAVASLIQAWYSENGKEEYYKKLKELGYQIETDQGTNNGMGQNGDSSSAKPSTENWTVDPYKPDAWSARSKRKITEKTAQCAESYLDVRFSARITSNMGSNTSEQLDKELRGWMSTSGLYPVEASIESITIGEFKGRLLTTTLKYNAGFGNPSAGYKSGLAHIGGFAILISEDGRKMLKVSYSSIVNSCWDNKTAELSKKEAAAGKSEAEQVLRSLTISGSKITAPGVGSSK